MSGRTWWNGRTESRSGDGGRSRASAEKSGLPLEEILDARFDEEGRLAQIGRGGRQRTAERLDPHPPAMSTEELERAVRKLSLGLAAIERESGPERMPEARPARPPGIQPPDPAAQGEPSRGDFVTHGLERLEARLASLSRRLQPGAAVPDPAPEGDAGRETPAGESAADTGGRESEAAAKPILFAEAEANLKQLDPDVWQDDDPTFAAQPSSGESSGAGPSETPPAAIARARLRADYAAEARGVEFRRSGNDESSGEHLPEEAGGGVAQGAESQLHSGERDLFAAGAEPGERGTQPAVQLKGQLAALEARIETLQRRGERDQIEPIRGELMRLLEEIHILHNDGRSVAAVLQQAHARLDQMESKINAARNMTGNRIGELQDRLSGVTERLTHLEAEVPGFDALREKQNAILERFDRMEGLVHRLAPSEAILERVEGLRRQLQSAASQSEVMRVKEQILNLVDRLDALPDVLSDRSVLERIEAKLQTLAAELLEARRHRIAEASALDRQFAELSAAVQAAAQSSRAPDLSEIQNLLSDLAGRVEESQRVSEAGFGRLDEHVTTLAETAGTHGSAAVREIAADLSAKIDALATAVALEDVGAGRRDLQAIDRKLDQLVNAYTAQGAEDWHAQLASFASDSRALQTQLEGIVSRLELLEGSSIDPARVAELFERVDAAIRRSGGGEHASYADERFARIEEKLDEIGKAQPRGGGLAEGAPAELHAEIVALRRELRSLPGGFGAGEENWAAVLGAIAARLDRLPEEPPATAAEVQAQIERVARLLQDPSHSRLTLAHIERSLKTIEARLEDTRRSYRPVEDPQPRADGDLHAVAGLARALSEDVSIFKTTAASSDQKTKEALEAVQDTLEAVVKRMAFLERDGDAAAAEERRPWEEPDAASAPAAAALSPHRGAEPAHAADVGPARAAALSEDPHRPVPGGLLGRFTSSQLLRRATGGRAESFTPYEEAEDYRDLPLEPGTDAPLSSALAGAPSSDTASSSGVRIRAGRRSTDLQPIRPAGTALEPVSANDFLAAARRAAKAAAEAAEAEEAERSRDRLRLSRIIGLLKPRRQAVLASLLAIAVAVAALQIVRGRTGGPAPAVPEPELAAAEPEISVADLSDPGQAEAASPAEPPPAGAPLGAHVSTTAPPPPPASPRIPEISASAPPSPEPAPAEPSPPSPTPTPVATVGPPPSTLEPPALPAPAQADDPASPPADAPAALAKPEPPPPPEPLPLVTASITPAVTEPPSAAPAPSSAVPAASPSPAEPAVDQAAPVPAEPPLPVGPERLQEAAKAGDPIAAFEVAARYAEGRGAAKDLPAAAAWYRRAAEAGLAPAQYRLGSIYEKGMGVPQDPAGAKDWYRHAAEAGNVKAMHNLAVLHAEGVGGEPDLERAAELFRRAAEHGVRDSQFNLAVLHARGLGVPQDMIEAYKWFAVAARSGDADALKRRDIIGAALSTEDLAKARAAADAFEPVPLVAEANEVTAPEGGWGEETASVELAPEKDVVALVQTLLAERGFDPGPADGVLGEQTTQAIMEFQEQAGLPATGRIDSELMAALQQEPT